VISHLLKERGLRQVDLERAFADRGMKLSQGLVNHWIHGRRSPSLSKGLMLARILRIDPQELLGGGKRVA